MIRITLALLVLFCLYYIYDPQPFGLENYDSFELVTAMITGGVAHPPGYGFYLHLNCWFHEFLSFWDVSPELSMTYFQCFCCFLAMLVFLNMIRLWQGSGLLFLFLMMSCASFTPNLYSVEVYGLLILLLSLSLNLYFFRIPLISVRIQNFLLGGVVSLMVIHHLSLAPLGALMIYRRFVEQKFSLWLILGLISGGISSVVMSFRASQSAMNPWFDGSNLEVFWQHITAKVYQVAFLDYGFHIDAWQNFISVWPLEIWVFIFIVLFINGRDGQSQVHLAILTLLIWPLIVYNIPDVSKPLITFYILIAVIVSCTKVKAWIYLVLLFFCCMQSFDEAHKLKRLGLSYKVRSMQQSMKDAHVAVSKKPQLNHTFIGYDSTFGIAYCRHVLRSKESMNMSIFPMWWLSFSSHLGSMNNHQYFSDNLEVGGVHWSGLKKSKLEQLYSSSYQRLKDFGANIIYPRALQFEQLKYALGILNDNNSILYVPSGKPDLIKYLRELGYSFINRGFWNQLKLKKRNKYVSDAIVQTVYLEKSDASNYFVHIMFLEPIDLEIELKLSQQGKSIGSVIQLKKESYKDFPLPIEKLVHRSVELQILSKGSLLSEVTLVID